MITLEIVRVKDNKVLATTDKLVEAQHVIKVGKYRVRRAKPTVKYEKRGLNEVHANN